MVIVRRINNILKHSRRHLHFFGQDYYHNKHSVMLENEILKAFILAEDNSTIELPEGHFLFSQSLHYFYCPSLLKS